MYTSRIVGVGLIKGDLVASFTLASKSIPYRELRINFEKGRINVFPRTGFEQNPENQDPEVDNYSCMRGGQLPSGASYVISFNGHMCKRVEANLKDGLKPLMALDQTLLEFRGLKHDARIGAIGLQAPNSGQPCTEVYLGVNDTDRGEKRVCAYPNERVKDLSDKLLFIYDTNTNFENIFRLDNCPTNPFALARYIHENIAQSIGGKELFFGVATGVIKLSGRSFELGVYNAPLSQEMIERWKKELKQKS